MTSRLSPARLFCARMRSFKNLVCNVIDVPVAVLCYHRVASRTSDINSMIVSPENFRTQMDYLKRNFRIVRFEETWDNLDKPAVAVTFDDGYADNLTEALPILENLGIPATFFISTGNLSTSNEFWWDALERMVSGADSCPARFSLQDPVHGKAWPCVTAEERMVMFQDLHQVFMYGTGEQRTEWLRQIEIWTGGRCPDAGINRLLTGDEVRELSNHSGVTIGAHSVTHPRLSALPEEEQRYEIVESGRLLSNIIGREVPVFAYPFGQKPDFDMTAARICREAGYLKAAAAFPGEAHRWTDPYRIPRHFIYNWDPDRFAYQFKRLWV